MWFVQERVLKEIKVEKDELNPLSENVMEYMHLAQKLQVPAFLLQIYHANLHLFFFLAQRL